MGSCNYYLKAKFPKALTEKQAKKIRDFIVEVARAESFWQSNRGSEPSEFWPDFKTSFPNATRYLESQGIDTKEGDCNNDLAGTLETGWVDYVDEAVEEIVKGIKEVHYTADVWHLASWEPLANWFKSEFGATSASWVSEEDLDEVDPFERF